jgi:4-amino-4-deoxy-L-arabinose transferase-like glycosyltransferase
MGRKKHMLDARTGFLALIVLVIFLVLLAWRRRNAWHPAMPQLLRRI